MNQVDNLEVMNFYATKVLNLQNIINQKDDGKWTAKITSYFTFSGGTMKAISLEHYTEFHIYRKGIGRHALKADEFLREQGFKSVSYNHKCDHWEIDDDDYYMFHFFWGNRKE